MSAKVLWNGKFLDGTLSIYTCPKDDSGIIDHLHFSLVANDHELSGEALLDGSMTIETNIEGMLELIKEKYLAETVKFKNKGVADGHIRLQ